MMFFFCFTTSKDPCRLFCYNTYWECELVYIQFDKYSNHAEVVLVPIFFQVKGATSDIFLTAKAPAAVF